MELDKIENMATTWDSNPRPSLHDLRPHPLRYPDVENSKLTDLYWLAYNILVLVEININKTRALGL